MIPRRPLAKVISAVAGTSTRAAERWLARETVDPDIEARLVRAVHACELTEADMGRPVPPLDEAQP